MSQVPAGFEFFEPLRLLFEWVEEQNYPYRAISDDYLLGTQIQLRGYTAEETATYVRQWFGDEIQGDPAARLWPFARTGGDGSMAALWLDDDGRTRIVHLGSGSGSTLTCVLADNGLDFLRLLAIGYREICWDGWFGAPPGADEDEDEDFEPVNEPYRDWLFRTFGATAPVTALEIVRAPADMGDRDTVDPFCRWVNHFHDYAD